MPSDLIPQLDDSRVAVVIGCGPSLTEDQIEKTRHLRQFGANRAFQFDIDVVLGCNWQFWDHYWDQIKDLRCHKWATHPDQEHNRPDGLRWIQGKWQPGISTDPTWIAYHHGSGPQILNLAYHYGARVMLLIGWDMRYPPNQGRHFFGEDPLTSKHYPRTGPGGELSGLIAEMATIKPEQYDLEIINCTPGSAMDCFPFMDLDDALKRYS